jgi:hypothetical protein
MFNNLFGWIGGLLSAIGNFFKHVYEWIVRHIIAQIIAKLTVVWNILNGILYPVVKFLRRIRAWYFKHIFPIQRAILEVISRVRLVLALLRLLHVKWAAKLDADLQRLAGYVTLSIQAVVTNLNTIDSYLSLMLDPGMILRKDFFAASLFSSLAGVKRAAGFGSNLPLSATDQQAEQDSGTLLYQRAPLATRDAEGNFVAVPAYENVLAESDASTAAYLKGLQ